MKESGAYKMDSRMCTDFSWSKFVTNSYVDSYIYERVAKSAAM